jgi:hypothetical protein
MKAQISLNGKLLYTISGVTEIMLDTDHPGLTTLWAGKNQDRRIIASIPKGHTVVGVPENAKKVEHIIDTETWGKAIDAWGKLYAEHRYNSIKETADKELTLEDCVKDNDYSFGFKGGLRHDSSLAGFGAGCYPTEAIAEKVLLYGLLQSVAYKLNEGKEEAWSICFRNELLCATHLCPANTTYGIVLFASRELAEKAIRIFKNSKFDLKKLFR